MSLGFSTGLTPPIDPVVVPIDSLLQLTVDQYHEMVRKGILTPGEPVELLEGYLVRKMPKNPAHCLVTDAIFEAFLRLAIVGYFPRNQNQITTTDSEPEPDCSLVRGRRSDFAKQHPTPADCALVVEVADTTLSADRTIKKRIYARSGVPVYWIVNLADRQVEVYSQPGLAGSVPVYSADQVFGEKDQLPVVIDGVEISRLPVHAILPPA